VFRLTPPVPPATQWTETVLYRFQGGYDAAFPSGGVTLDSKGALYGMTTAGGQRGGCGGGGCGTVYKLTPPVPPATQWKETVLERFTKNGEYGYSPSGSLIIDSQGALYGTNELGGLRGCPAVIFGGVGCGAVFKLTPPVPPATQWTETLLYYFQGGQDGYLPMGVTFDSKGAIYGTTPEGGGSPACGSSGGYTLGCCTVFKLTPPVPPATQWTETVLYSFQGGEDGFGPGGGVTFDSEGALYGYADGGLPGCFGSICGLVFKLTPPVPPATQWTETVLYDFQGGTNGGDSSSLIIDSQGALYGTTFDGGGPPTCYYNNNACGTVFKLTPPVPPATQWTEAVLYYFQGGADGAEPYAGVTFGSKGALYGTTGWGGHVTSDGGPCCGTVFMLSNAVSMNRTISGW
jgi:hypothetical protein